MLSKKLKYFIVGAPKCGTTSLAAWLDAHPNVFMCKPKEPYFFSWDIQSSRAASIFDEYLSLFRDVSDQHHAVGEASTTYLRSKVAIEAIEKSFDRPRYIVCLRNPVDMAQSVYSQLLKSGRENASSFEEAWGLQESRQRGKGLPKGTGDPADLQYGEMCKLGKQLESMLEHVGPERVLLLFLEDVKNDPETEYLRVLSFLGVPDTGWRSFSVENSRGVPRSLFLVRTLRFFGILKQKLGLKSQTGIGERLLSLITRKPVSHEKELDGETKRSLSDYFKSDIQLLASLADRNLDHWLVQ